MIKVIEIQSILTCSKSKIFFLIVQILFSLINILPSRIILPNPQTLTMQKQQFGIMDEGYFVPKSEILAWINALLQINITKIQALGSGSIYCQIFDVIHPGKINLAKVNWKAKNDNEFLANFRLLQTACEKIGIKRHIEVEKLVKAKYQDNLQFIQWFKRYFDTNCGNKGQGYDAVEKRNKVVPDFSFCEKVVVPKTFNGAGQVAPRENKVTSPNAKKEQMPPRVKSPKTVKTPVVTAKKTPVVPKKTEQKKEQPKKPEVKKVEEKKEEPKKPITKKPEEVKEPTTKPLAQKKPQEKKPTEVPKTAAMTKRPTTAIELPKKVAADKNAAEISQLKQKLKEMTEKVDIIKEIVISQDGADMKVQMIKEVLNIVTQKPTTQETVSVSQNQQQQSAQSKPQEQSVTVTENISSANEDLLINDEPQFEQAQTQQKPVSQTPVESHQEQLQSQQQDLLQQDTHQEAPHEEAPVEEAHQEEAVESEAAQEQSHPEEKPDLSQSNAIPSQQDDDVI